MPAASVFYSRQPFSLIPAATQDRDAQVDGLADEFPATPQSPDPSDLAPQSTTQEHQTYNLRNINHSARAYHSRPTNLNSEAMLGLSPWIWK